MKNIKERRKDIDVNKKDVWSNKDLIRKIKKEVIFLQELNSRMLTVEEVKLVMLVNYLEFITKEKNKEKNTRNEILNSIANSTCKNKDRKDQHMIIDHIDVNTLKDVYIDLKKEGTSNNKLCTLTNKDFKNALNISLSNDINQNTEAYITNDILKSVIIQEDEIYIKGLEEETKVKINNFRNIDLGLLHTFFSIVCKHIIHNLLEKKPI